jgi:ethanolamine utilization protein EutN
MYLGRIIGTIWATRKYEAVTSYKMQFIQPINAEKEKLGEPIVAIDTIGAGPGEIVFYITASEAVIPLLVDMAPIDASIVGIVDSINVES